MAGSVTRKQETNAEYLARTIYNALECDESRSRNHLMQCPTLDSVTIDGNFDLLMVAKFLLERGIYLVG